MINLNDIEIIKLYKDGLCCREIANLCLCSNSTIRNILINNQIKLRSLSDSHKKIRDVAFIKLYNMGLSTEQVSILLNTDASTVTKRLASRQFITRTIKHGKSISYSEEEFDKYFLRNISFQRILSQWV